MTSRLPQFSCGLDAAVSVVGGKWKPLILWALSESPMRFGELRRYLTGISEKMLAQQLREMEADGLVHREVFAEIPPKVQYSLARLGVTLNEALMPLGDWGSEYMDDIIEARTDDARPAV